MTDDTVTCDRCTDRDADPEIAPHADYSLCRQCVAEVKQESAKAGEKGAGPRTIGHERAIKRGERCGSGWPI